VVDELFVSNGERVKLVLNDAGLRSTLLAGIRIKADAIVEEMKPQVAAEVQKVINQVPPATLEQVRDTYARSWENAYSGIVAKLNDDERKSLKAAMDVAEGKVLQERQAAKGRYHRIHCASNMRMIGLGLLHYGKDHKNQLPPDLGALATSAGIGPEHFVCPSATGDLVLPPNLKSRSPQEQAAWVNANAMYVYAVPAKSLDQIGATDILLYEDPLNHIGRNEGLSTGMNIVFGDAHVERHSMEDANRILKRAGIEPRPESRREPVRGVER
jgi:hypothetical protein